MASASVRHASGQSAATSRRRYWEKEGWCTGIVAQSLTRRDTRVHHIVYDLVTASAPAGAAVKPGARPSWELAVALPWSQANEKWRIPRPARYVQHDWASVVVPEPGRKGGKRQRGSSVQPGSSSKAARRAKGDGANKSEHEAGAAALDAAAPAAPAVEAAAVVDAKRRAESGDASAVHKVLAAIEARRCHIVHLAALNQLSAGLEQMRAPLPTSAPSLPIAATPSFSVP